MQAAPAGGDDAAGNFVLVIAADGTAHKHPITIGLRTPEQVQVLSGVTPQDLVITTGAYGLDEGTKVKVGHATGDKSDDDNPANAKPDAAKPSNLKPGNPKPDAGEAK